ncbi:hypothetical protein HYH02_007778 [Chlamydomonas schloesseri]|uniref:Hikeshi-like domain-containing protein n=1 Tax=Chlamydomonas schloesseri TaxID=2026947 RepID=A0A835WHQ7_9CHLO|nr:hypothetical protein HYH02_007778 [Chlamydomonas schloesseri]|eukprot:KAG2447454.1 hypothetical protein HYH02_007778 [Chlamydomonas schloesseri]
MASGFGLFFVGHTVPITHEHLTQVDPTHWVLDASVIPNVAAMREVALFLLPGSALDPQAALGLYVRAGGAEWSYRGCVHNAQPSAVLPLQWPLAEDGSVISAAAGGPGVQIGVSLEPAADIVARETSSVGAKAEFAKRVGLDLFRYLESFQTQNMGSHIVVPANALERWYTRFQDKFRRDPDFLTRNTESLNS